jgi:hypothetical protein
MFLIYADESGKLAKSDYTSLCGYVGHSTEWGRFGGIWNNCRLRWGVPPLHMSRIMNPEKKDDVWRDIRRKWGDDWEPKRDAMLNDFGNIVASCGCVAVGAVVHAAHFRKIQHSQAAFPHIRDSNVFAFQHLLMRGIEKVNIVDPLGTITLVVDDDPENAWDYYGMLDRLKTHSDPTFADVRNRVSAICFGDDNAFPGIQAADMLAWTARDYMVASLKKGEHEPPHLYYQLSHFSCHQPVLYSDEGLDRLAHSVAEKVRLEKEANAPNS